MLEPARLAGRQPAARHFLALMYGPGVPYARARRALPLLERWADLNFPEGSADAISDFRDPKYLADLKEITGQYSKRVLQDKLINPEFAFVTRAEMGLQHLMHELGAKVNLGQIWRQVTGTYDRGSPRIVQDSPARNKQLPISVAIEFLYDIRKSALA